MSGESNIVELFIKRLAIPRELFHYTKTHAIVQIAGACAEEGVGVKPDHGHAAHPQVVDGAYQQAATQAAATPGRTHADLEQLAAAPLDQVLTSLLNTLGIGLGQADSWVSGVRCGGAVLIQ